MWHNCTVTSLLTPLIRYAQRTKLYPVWRFIAELVVVGYIAKIVVALVFVATMAGVYVIFGFQFPEISDPSDDSLRHDFAFQFITGIIVAPLVETVFGQFLPLKITRRFTQKTWIQIVVAAIFFTAFHHPARYITAVVMGVILAWSFILYARVSLKAAFGVTIVMHALHNMVASLIQTVFPIV